MKTRVVTVLFSLFVTINNVAYSTVDDAELAKICAIFVEQAKNEIDKEKKDMAIEEKKREGIDLKILKEKFSLQMQVLYSNLSSETRSMIRQYHENVALINKQLKDGTVTAEERDQLLINLPKEHISLAVQSDLEVNSGVDEIMELAMYMARSRTTESSSSPKVSKLKFNKTFFHLGLTLENKEGQELKVIIYPKSKEEMRKKNDIVIVDVVDLFNPIKSVEFNVEYEKSLEITPLLERLPEACKDLIKRNSKSKIDAKTLSEIKREIYKRKSSDLNQIIYPKINTPRR